MVAVLFFFVTQEVIGYNMSNYNDVTNFRGGTTRRNKQEKQKTSIDDYGIFCQWQENSTLQKLWPSNEGPSPM